MHGTPHPVCAFSICYILFCKFVSNKAEKINNAPVLVTLTIPVQCHYQSVSLAADGLDGNRLSIFLSSSRFVLSSGFT